MNPNKLLDQVREGRQFTDEQIVEALIATGDIALPIGVRSTRVVQAIPGKNTSCWNDSRSILVVERKRRFRAIEGQASHRCIKRFNE